MEMMGVGIESIEAAMRVGAMVVDQIGSVAQGAYVAGDEATCEICRCEWA
ncbi:hypothetical protein [Arenimonas sp.]